MNNYLVATLGISILFLISCSSSQNNDLPPLTTVDQVDLNRYAGLWYEVAKIPNSFQDQCAYGTTAEYKIQKDGSIQVINKCYDENGEPDIADGVANVVDKKTNSKLEVSFVSFLGIRPFWGDYWIIGLDENYRWAIVGTPGRKYGWVLSRTPTLPDETMQEIYEILKSQNYDPATFEISIQK
ncbi:MAG TPA: lipocalin family protein [Ignavibacteriaceae bacterium]|nr:lipocalin family protein [Ignavibacteriaceae bacterium]